MLYRVTGRAGSGKTTYLLSRLKEAFEKGTKCLYIVPEQQSLSTEKKLSEYLGDRYNMLIEVLNFERLPNRIAREYGGLAVKYIDEGGRDILMSLTLYRLSEKLTEYKGLSTNGDFIKSILSVIERLKRGGISAQKFKEAADNEQIKQSSRLYSKLKDISLIYSTYSQLLTEELNDPLDALSTLSKALECNRFFEDYIVFIDGYYTFTEQEYAIIKHIVKQSRDTYISFTLDGTDSHLFKDNKACADRIMRESSKPCKDITTGGSKRFRSPLIRHIEENLWETVTLPTAENDSSVRIIEASSPFEEAEAIASEIFRLIREDGLRYRDISLVFGSLTEYKGVIDVVLERNNIPYYMAVKDELATKPLFSFILSALEAVFTDCSLTAMKKYIKSGFMPLNVGECDILLRYAEMWNIQGRRWYDEAEWMMNPEGYREELSRYGSKILKITNKAREKVMLSLSNLRQTLLQKDVTVKRGAEALYELLIDMEIDSKLLQRAQHLRDTGNEEEAQKERQLWDMLINIFDQLCYISGEEKVTPRRLFELIKLMSEEYTVGSIPTSADQIRISDAKLFRPDACSAQILGGVNDGIFPSFTGGDGFFEDEELMMLEQAGCVFSSSKIEMQNRERFLFYAAATAPSEQLIITYPSTDFSGAALRPSFAVNRIKRLIPSIETKHFGERETDYLYSKESAAFYAPTLRNTELKKQILSKLGQKGIIIPSFAPLFQEKAFVKIQDSSIKFSPSKIERYNYCPFSYYAGYLLRLRKKQRIRFATQEIGNFIHKILEQFLKERTKEGRFNVPTDQQINEAVETLTDEYLFRVASTADGSSRRFMHTCSNLKKTLNLVLHNLSDEFAQSKFLPVGFEQKIGSDEEGSLPPICYEMDGDRYVTLRGSIDRVDAYETNGITYVRVVDYKTYSKPFSLELVEEGIDTQMLSYLFAYCAAGENRKPAGILYYAAKLPTITADGDESEEIINRKLQRELKRTGLLLRSREIIEAMEEDANGVFVPVRIKNDGDFYSDSEKRLLDADGFSELEKALNNQIITLAGEIFNGNMCIRPKQLDDMHNACKYCDYNAVCRYTE